MFSERRSKILDRIVLAIASCTFLVTCVLLLDDDLLFKLQKNKALPGLPVAKITNSEKDVRRRLDGDIIWFPVRQKDAVFQDDSIFTGDSSRTDVLFQDQTSLAVSAQSLVRISIHKGQTTLQLISGSMRVKVAPKSKVVLVANGKTKSISGKDAVAEITAKPKQDLTIRAISGTVELQEGIATDTPSATPAPIQKLVAIEEETPKKETPPLISKTTDSTPSTLSRLSINSGSPSAAAVTPAPSPAKSITRKTATIPQTTTIVPLPTPSPTITKAKSKLILDSDWTFQSSLGVYAYSGQSGISGLTTASTGIAAKLGLDYKAWFNESWGAVVSGGLMNLRNLSDSTTLLKTVSVDMNYQWLNPVIGEASQTSTKWRSSIGAGLGLREDLQVDTPTARSYPFNLGLHWRADLSKRLSSAWAFESTLIGLIPFMTTQSGTTSDSIGMSQFQFLNFELQAVMKRSIGKKMSLNFGVQAQNHNAKYTQALGTTSNQFTTFLSTVSLNLGF